MNTMPHLGTFDARPSCLTGGWAPTYADLAAAVNVAPNQHRRRVLQTGLRQWMVTLGFDHSQPATDLAHDAVEAALGRYMAMPGVARLSAGARNNRRSAIRGLAQIYGNLLTQPRTKRPDRSWRASALHRPLFNLRNPASTWGDTIRELACASYYLKALPDPVTAAIAPFLAWRDHRHGSAIELELLDGSTRRIVCNTAWTHSNRADVSKPSPSETLFVEGFRAFYGFAILPSDAIDPTLRGLGIRPADLRLSHFLLPENVSAYLQFLRGRSGHYTTNAAAVITRWKMLMKGDIGYARWAQRRLYDDLKHVLGADVPETVEAWRTWCDKQVARIAELEADIARGRSVRSRFRQTRSAAVSLAILLTYERPLEQIVWPTIYCLADDRPPSSAPTGVRFQYEQTIFTLVALITSALRNRNCAELRWGQDLFRAEGGWTVSLSLDDFKNRRWLKEGWLSMVEDTAQEFFTRYYELWKLHFGYDPLLPKHAAKISLVMASPRESACTPLGKTVISQRLKFLHVMWGMHVGPSAFRHIIVTDWLKRFPDDLSTPAGLLNDSLSTIAKAYAHLRGKDHTNHLNKANHDMEKRARAHLATAVKHRACDTASTAGMAPPASGGMHSAGTPAAPWSSRGKAVRVGGNLFRPRS